MNEVNCPYCDHEFDICQDDGHGTSEDTTYQEVCPECEKTFVFTVSWSPFYSAEKADCLNEGEHDWRPMRGAPVEYFHGMQRCSMCSEERSTDEEGRKKAIEEMNRRWESESAPNPSPSE